MWATAHRCSTGEEPVPIGQPIPGATAQVVDRWLRPRPPGASGELVVGGAGVTDGYLDDPERTAEAFVTMRPTGGASIAPATWRASVATVAVRR